MGIRDRAKRDDGVETAAGQRVEIGLHSATTWLGSATTDGGGRFSATVQVLGSITPGRHFIVALAPKPNGGKAAFVFPLTVAAPAAAPASVDSPRAAKHFPWLPLEAVLGTLSVVVLFVVRVQNATAGRSQRARS